MKTIALIALLFTSSLITNAQLRKGQWMIGGTADVSHNNSETTLAGADLDSKATAYRIAPGVAYFFIDRLAGGLRINISSNKTEDDRTGIIGPGAFSRYHAETKISGVGFSPFLRYYFLPVSRKINVFADAAYSHNEEKSETRTWFRNDNPPLGSPNVGESFSKNSFTSGSFSIAAGPVLFINPKVSFELSVGYQHRSAKSQDLKSSSILLGTGFQVYFGK